MILNIILFLGGLCLLIKGADIFIDGSSYVARKLNISEMIIGITLVCFGTGLPELILSLTGSIKNETALVIPNMIGSNIFNMCMILGLVSVIHPIKFLKETVRKDMHMSLLTGIVFLVIMLDTPFTYLTENVVSRTDGLILLAFFAVFLYYTVYEFGGITEKRRKRKEERKTSIDKESKRISKEDKIELIKGILTCIIGGGIVYFGSELVLKSTTNLAYIFCLSETFMAIIFVAVGTSLPEIVTSIVAIKKGSINIAIGNLIGSNMFNLLFVVGICSVINPIVLATNTLWIDALVFILVALLISTFANYKFINKGEYELARTEGIILIVMYIAYILYVSFRM